MSLIISYWLFYIFIICTCTFTFGIDVSTMIHRRQHSQQIIHEPNRALYLYNSRIFDDYHSPTLRHHFVSFKNLFFTNDEVKTTGSGVRIYIVDDGCRQSTSEIRELIIDSSGSTGKHGSDVTRTIQELAPHAELICVSIFDQHGISTLLLMKQALELIVVDCKKSSTDKKCIVNISGGTAGISPVLDVLVDDLVQNDNIIVVAAAGNHFRNACLYSPGRGQNVITAGAIGMNYQFQLSSSNFGSCVSLLAFSVTGTSISAAITSAFVAHVWEMHPVKNAMEITRHVVQKRASPHQIDELPLQTTNRIASLRNLRNLDVNDDYIYVPAETRYHWISGVQNCISFQLVDSQQELVFRDGNVIHHINIIKHELTTNDGTMMIRLGTVHDHPSSPSSSDDNNNNNIRIEWTTEHLIVYIRYQRIQWTRPFGITHVGLIGPAEAFHVNVNECMMKHHQRQLLLSNHDCSKDCQPPCFKFDGKCRSKNYCEFPHRSMCERRKHTCIWKDGECIMQQQQ
jgi:hypothetical protein